METVIGIIVALFILILTVLLGCMFFTSIIDYFTDILPSDLRDIRHRREMKRLEKEIRERGN